LENFKFIEKIGILIFFNNFGFFDNFFFVICLFLMIWNHFRTMFVILVNLVVPKSITYDHRGCVSSYFVWYPQVKCDLFGTIYFMISRVHVNVSETYSTSFLQNHIFFIENLDFCIWEKFSNIVSSVLMSGFYRECYWLLLFSLLPF
jgi:hypothetical protein